ncbi:MAG: hypothetical protein ACRDWY_08470 [Actinomycetes bacterium]
MTTGTSVTRPTGVSAALERATRVADVMLFEGYVLYPYRASAHKNRLRWQFGVLMAPGYGADSGEHAASRTEVLVEPRGRTVVHLQVRFLQAQRREVERLDGSTFRPTESLALSDRELVPWDEGVVRDVDVDVELDRVLDGGHVHEIAIGPGTDHEDVEEGGAVVGRLVRRREALQAAVRLSAERLGGPYGAVRLRVVLENTSAWTPRDDADRAGALRHALVAAHLLIGLSDGTFLSLLEPPEWARPFAEGCVNEHTWPVLVGPGGRDDVVLSSPIILYDHPEVDPESPGDLYDATEIDEILSLRTLALTEQEKREARGTDPRAAAVIDRVDAMPPEVLDRLHGTVRYVREVTGSLPSEPPFEPHDREDVPWWDPGADASVSPETDGVVIGGVRVARGSKVRLRPRLHGADAQDLFLVGRTATVEAVLLDVDDDTHLAVTLDDDPGADLQRSEGRYLYFRPDEVEPT